MPKITNDLSISFFLHILIILFFFIINKYSPENNRPLPYIVTLVDSVSISESRSISGSPSQDVDVKNIPQEKNATGDKKALEDRMAQVSTAKTKSTMSDDSVIRESIDALRAKKDIERIVALRKMIDVGGTQGSGVRDQKTEIKPQSGYSGANTSSQGILSQGIGNDYYSLIVQQIRQQWVFPERLERDLEAIVSIKISRDGSVTIERIEKSSGNKLFDRSVLMAINKASPLPPPVKDIEIGVRFRP